MVRDTCRSKYGNRKVMKDGVVFDSIKEFHRYSELKLLERAGKIWDLKRQVPFTIIPTQKVGGRVVERACKYIADFTYMKSGADGLAELVVEDTKGFKTPEYIIKRKLMLKEFGIQIKEV